MATATAKRRKPPIPEVCKDNPVNIEYETRAKTLLRERMVESGHDYAAFMLQCFNAMGIKL